MEQKIDVKLTPHCAPCYNFLENNKEDKKTVWLVPHVIKNTHSGLVIIWRCNLGHICESGCLYAKRKERVNGSTGNRW